VCDKFHLKCSIVIDHSALISSYFVGTFS